MHNAAGMGPKQSSGQDISEVTSLVAELTRLFWKFILMWRYLWMVQLGATPHFFADSPQDEPAE